MRALPKVTIDGSAYFRDDRLREFRNVRVPWLTIPYAIAGAEARVELLSPDHR